MSSPGAPPSLILASASPRRRELLAQLAVPFTILPADIDERVLPAEAPWAYARRVAYAKARHVARQRPDAVVLGADSVVILEQHIFGKPHDTEDAAQMLRRLSGRTHTVMTALAIIHQTRQIHCLDAVSTRVRFHTLTPDAIAQYIATGEPMDKAGAYAIQGAAAAFVAAWEG
ncbi:MAG: septum formation inhibitor Maf, partial [Candidatus Tectomicrobia bacterium]|nr:septum formation inhibitor Maf [Candidatus Tectomicrobia bacterium]